MEYLNGKHYVKVKGHCCMIHPTESRFLQKRDPPLALRTQYRSQNNTQFRRVQQVIKNDNDDLVVKNYPKKKQPNIQQRQINLPKCPSCKKNNCLEFDKGHYCRNCELINKKIKLI